MMNQNKVNVKDFVTEAFDYLNTLTDCSINRSVNRYLLEYIAYGYAQYGSTENFIENIDNWIRMLVKIYPEIGFDHATHQLHATIELIDQLVVIDDELKNDLDYIINILSKYGLLIHYRTKDVDNQTTLSRFFEFIERKYPVIQERYKGLGSSDPEISRQVIMDPRTRRIMRVTMEDINTMKTLGMLVGDGKENMKARKEMLMNFKFSKDMIDN
jgi:hypothetical protein